MIHFEHPAVCGIRAANVTSTRQLAGVTCPACRNIAGTLARTQVNRATTDTKNSLQAMGFTTDAAPVQVQIVPAPQAPAPIHTLPVKEPPMQISTQIPANTTKTRKSPKRKGKK